MWPSGGAGSNSTTITSGTNAGNGNDGYEIAFNINNSAGTIWIDHCDIWGFGDAIVNQTTTAQTTITNNWMHDIVDPSPQVYHTDGPGYSNGATGPNNINIIGNTIAFSGNTNLIAYQAQTGGATKYHNINVISNYLSGDNASIAWCRSGGCVSSAFYGNVFGTDVKNFGVIDTGASIGTSSVWACNTIAFRTGTSGQIMTVGRLLPHEQPIYFGRIYSEQRHGSREQHLLRDAGPFVDRLWKSRIRHDIGRANGHVFQHELGQPFQPFCCLGNRHAVLDLVEYLRLDP